MVNYFSLDRKDFIRALENATAVILASSPMDIINHVKLAVNDPYISIYSTNLETFYTERIHLTDITHETFAFSFWVKPKPILAILKSFTEKEITIKWDAETNSMVIIPEAYQESVYEFAGMSEPTWGAEKEVLLNAVSRFFRKQWDRKNLLLF